MVWLVLCAYVVSLELKLLTSSLALGIVWHKRYTPKLHEFNYKLNSWLIDIDNYDQLAINNKWISIDKFNLYTFDTTKYLRGHSGSISDKVRSKLLELGAKLDLCNKIFFLGQLKNLGLYFSPLNLYICYSNDNVCRYVLAEVSNTPWNERHYYLIDLAQPELIIAKKFHVSPFWNINQAYHWQFDIKPERMYFQIDNYQQQQKVFSAGYSVDFISVAEKAMITNNMIKQPLSVWKIVATIYYEALKIFMKKIPFVPYQKRKS